MSARKPRTTTTGDATDEAGDATSGIVTLEDIRAGRPPESGPSDSSDGVTLTSPSGSKVTVPERMTAALKAQGYK